MKTRSLYVLILVMVLVVVGAWMVLSGEEGGLMQWLASLHGRPAGH